MAGRKGSKVGKEGGEDVGDEGLWGSACFLLTCLAALSFAGSDVAFGGQIALGRSSRPIPRACS